MDILVLGMVGFCGFFVGFGCCYGVFYLSERRAVSIMRQKANAKGTEQQKEDADELMELLGEISASFQIAKTNNVPFPEFMAKEVPQIALRHPRVAFKYARKLEKLISTLDVGESN